MSNKRQEQRLESFVWMIKQNRIFTKSELIGPDCVTGVLMYFSGIFCENATKNGRKPRRKESRRSICRVIQKSHPSWNNDIISYFVFQGDDKVWQLTDVVKNRLDELGVKYQNYSFEQHKEDIPYVPDTVETKSTETKTNSAKFLEYNHSSLIEWYKEFISSNDFNKANDRDFQVIEAIKVNIPLSEFVSSFNESEKNNPRPYYSSVVKKHAKNFQTDTKTEEVVKQEEEQKEPENPDEKVITREIRMRTVAFIKDERNSFKSVYNTFYKGLSEKTKSVFPSYEEFHEKNSKYNFYSRTVMEIRKDLEGYMSTEGKEIKQREIKSAFVQCIKKRSNELAENQKLIEMNQKKKNPEPVNQNEDLTNGAGLDDDFINELFGGK